VSQGTLRGSWRAGSFWLANLVPTEKSGKEILTHDKSAPKAEFKGCCEVVSAGSTGQHPKDRHDHQKWIQ
jgi:hypothetical protein